MLSRWQHEYSCDWCGTLSKRSGGRVSVYGRTGWGTLWRICPACIDRLRATRDAVVWGEVAS
jgi:hypothetical protein